MSEKEPFKEGTMIAQYYEIYSDLEWHCEGCVKEQIGSTQTAAQNRDLRNRGYAFEKNGNKWEVRKHCEICGKNTPHRKMLSKKPINSTSIRSGFSTSFTKRIKTVLGNIDAIDERHFKSAELEIDHRFPHVRWSKDEELDENMSDEDIKATFMLLTRSNNLLKSRACERCAQTNTRGWNHLKWWYEGDETWNNTCSGCFFFDPTTWYKEATFELHRK